MLLLKLLHRRFCTRFIVLVLLGAMTSMVVGCERNSPVSQPSTSRVSFSQAKVSYGQSRAQAIAYARDIARLSDYSLGQADFWVEYTNTDGTPPYHARLTALWGSKESRGSSGFARVCTDHIHGLIPGMFRLHWLAGPPPGRYYPGMVFHRNNWVVIFTCDDFSFNLYGPDNVGDIPPEVVHSEQPGIPNQSSNLDDVTAEIATP